MRTAIVTGATGCIGFHVVQELIAEGNWEILALHRVTSNTSMFVHLPVKLVEVDLYDEASVVAAIPQGADAIFHVAANVSHFPDPNQWKDNVLATRNLVKGALQKKVHRFIFTSTGATLPGEGDSDPESIARKLPNQYAYTKRLAELEISKGAEQGLDVVILHPIIVLGAHDFHGNYSQLFENNILTQFRTVLPGHMEFCDAEKVAKAHLQSFHRGKTGASYLLGGKYLSWFGLFTIIAEETGTKRPLYTIPTWSLHLIALVHMLRFRLFGTPPEVTPELVWLLQGAEPNQLCDVLKTEQDLGYRKDDVDIRELCRRVSHWMKRQ